MAYTRPSVSAADASWAGAAAYTRPGAADADAEFGSGLFAIGFSSTLLGAPTSRCTQDATGFVSGNFGTPLAPYASTGFRPTQFGTPYAVFTQIGVAAGFRSTTTGVHSMHLPVTGFQPTQFGTPFGVFWQIADATGFNPTQLGTVAGWQHWDMDSWIPKTRFGTPTTPTDRTSLETGFNKTRFGDVIAIRYAPPNLDRTQRASGFFPTVFGLAQASPVWSGSATGATITNFGAPTVRTGHDVAGVLSTWFGTPSSLFARRATGFRSTTFGTASSRRTLAATAIASTHLGTPRARSVQGVLAGAPATAFGTPSNAMRQRSAGFAPVAFGQPTVVITQQAAHTYRATRFGLPTTWRSNTYLAHGINCSGRFGQPLGVSRFNYATTGFRSTGVGAPTCHQRHRVGFLAPSSRFGTPLLRRNPFCDQHGKTAGASGTRLGAPRLHGTYIASGLYGGSFGLPTT